MARTLINAGWILSMDPDIGDIKGGAILIEDDRIVAVGHDLSADGAEVIDAGNMIVMPGLVNAHIHLWQTGLRGVAGTWVSDHYHKYIHGNLATHYTAEDTYVANLLGALSQIGSGCTTVVDWCHNNATPEHSDRAIDALFESGIRAVFAHGTVKPPQKPGEPHFSEIPHPRAEIERLRRGRLSDDDALVTLAMAILGPDFGTGEVLLADLRLAREYGLMSSSHVWNTPRRISKEGFFPAAEAGLLGPDHNVVHGNFCTDEEVGLFVECGCSVTATPTCEMQSGFGDPLTGRLLALGVSPSLGSDTELYVAADMFHVMRFALQSQRILEHRKAVAAGAPLKELTITARQALEWATIEGARAAMMADRIGSLSPGKQADLIMLRADDVNLFPVNDPVHAVVMYAGPENVDTVMIAGRAVKSAGRLACPANVIAEAQAGLAVSVERIFRDGDYVHQPG